MASEFDLSALRSAEAVLEHAIALEEGGNAAAARAAYFQACSAPLRCGVVERRHTRVQAADAYMLLCRCDAPSVQTTAKKRCVAVVERIEAIDAAAGRRGPAAPARPAAAAPPRVPAAAGGGGGGSGGGGGGGRARLADAELAVVRESSFVNGTWRAGGAALVVDWEGGNSLLRRAPVCAIYGLGCEL